MAIVEIGVAQDFKWLNGTTGRSTGNGIEFDKDGNSVVVGAFQEDNSTSNEFGLPENLNLAQAIPPNPSFSNVGTEGFVAVYDQMGDPLRMAVLNNVASLTSPCVETVDDYTIPKKVTVDRDGGVHIVGITTACAIAVNDTMGNTVFTMENPLYGTGIQVMFEITYINPSPGSPQLIPDYGYIFYSDEPSFAGDVKIISNPGTYRIYLAGSFKGVNIHHQSFGNAPAISGISQDISDLDYQIYIAQIDVGSKLLTDEVIFGDVGDDYVYSLSDGMNRFNGGPSHLFASGSFANQIDLNTPSGLSTLSSSGLNPWVMRFEINTLQQQIGLSMTGADAEALAISNDGNIVGGWFENGNLQHPGGYVTTSAITRQAFYARIDWSTLTMFWQQKNVSPEDIAVHDIEVSNCRHIYIATQRGAYMSPRENFMENPSYNNSVTLTGWTNRYSTALFRLVDYGITDANGTGPDWWTPPPTPVLAYNFLQANQPNVMTGNINSNLITDLSLRYSDAYSGEQQLAFVGRFGEEVNIPSSATGGNTTFDGTTTSWPSTSNEIHMFLGTVLDSIPLHDSTDLGDLCLTDNPIEIPTNFVASVLGWFPPTYSTLIFDSFAGPGIDSNQFNPQLAGVGQHTIVNHGRFFECPLLPLPVYTIDVYREKYPRQPETALSEWAEGLAAEGITPKELIPYGIELDFEINYLAGKYYDRIDFDKEGGGTMSLTAPPGQEAGYIVAYGPCGAYWALNITSGGDAFIEALEFGPPNDDAEVPMPFLYAVGGITDTVRLRHSEELPMPTDAVSGLAFSNIGNNVEKGILLQINPITGDVSWVYLGGDDPNEGNRFHDLATEPNYVGVIGERWTNFTYSDAGVTTVVGAYQNEDPIAVVLSPSGDVYFTDIGPSGFGGPGNDHGDAIDMITTDNGIAILMGGYIEPGLFAHDYLNLKAFGIPPFAIPPADGRDAYVALIQYNTNANVLTRERCRIIEGQGNDEVRDVLLAGKLSPDVDFVGPNQIFWCGTFSEHFYTDHAPGMTTMSTLAGDYDAYIGSMDVALDDNWLTHEGSVFGVTESANALAQLGKQLFAYGEIQDVITVSNFYNAANSGAFPSTSSLLVGAGVTPQRHTIFTTTFTPWGGLIDNVFAEAVNVGLNQGWDITPVDTSFVSAGSIGAPGAIEFQKSSGLIHHTLYRNSSVSDAFLGRLAPSLLEYFKSDLVSSYADDMEEITIYPNPNDGSFSIGFRKVFDGVLQVYDLQGRLLFEDNLNDQLNFSLKLTLDAGVYSVLLKGAKRSEVLSFVVY